MNLSDYRDEVRAIIRRDSSVLPDARLTRWINWAVRDICRYHTFNAMRTRVQFQTSDGTSDYSYPSRMKDLYSITILDGMNSRKLHYVSARDFDEKRPKPDEFSEDIPILYVDNGSTFTLYRIPNTTYTGYVRCSQYPEELSDDTDTLSIEMIDDVVVAGAVVIGFVSIRELDDADWWFKKMFLPRLRMAVASERKNWDYEPIARPHSETGKVQLFGKYWLDPFVKGV